ncbi:MAG: hypothetical protein AB7S36_05015, partial [Planctomycetota bacterium]
PQVSAQDPDPPAQPDKRVIYVPYKDLQQALDKPDGVFLPYAEFEALWKKATATAPDRRPDTAALIHSVEYDGQVTGDTARFTATLKLRTFVAGWISVPLPFGKDIACREATVDGQLALLAAHGQGYELLLDLPKAADGQPQVSDKTLKLVFEVPVRPDANRADWRTVGFGVPRAAVAQLNFSVDQPSLVVEVSPRIAAVEPGTSDGQRTGIKTFLGNGDTLAVSWKTEVTRKEQEAVVSASQATVCTLAEGVITLSSQISLSAIQGTFDEVLVELPKDYNLRTPDSGDWQSFSRVPGATPDSQRLRVKLRAPAAEYRFAITVQRVVPDIAASHSLPLFRVVGVTLDRGYIAVFADDALDLAVGESKGLSPATWRELPEFCQAAGGGKTSTLAFQFLNANEVALPVTVTRKQPQISVWLNHRLEIDETQLTLRAIAEVKVEKAGIFAISFVLPEGYTVLEVGPLDSVVKAWRESQDDPDGPDGPLPARRTLNVELRALTRGTATINLALQRALGLENGLPRQKDGKPVVVDLPVIRVPGVLQERGHYGVGAKDTVNVETGTLTGLQPLGVAQTFERGGAPAGEQPLVLAMQFIAAGTNGDAAAPLIPVAGQLRLSLKDAQVSVEVIHYVQVTDEGIERRTLLIYTIQFAGVDTFRVRVKADKAPTFDARALASQPTPAADDKELYVVKTNEKQRGQWVLSLSWQESLKSLQPNKQEPLAFPVVQPQEVAAEFGSYLIAKRSTIHIGGAKTEACSPIDPTDPQMVAVMQRVASALAESASRSGSTLAAETPALAWRYQAHPHTISMMIMRREFSQLYAVVVHRLHLDVDVNAEYRARVTALVEFQARGLQSLAVELPAGASQVRVRKGSTDIAYRVGDKPEQILIPLDAAESDVMQKRAIDYTLAVGPADSQLGMTGTVNVPVPSLGDAPINETTWNFSLPGRFNWSSDDPAYDFEPQHQVMVDWSPMPEPSRARAQTDATRVSFSRRVGAMPVKLQYTSDTWRNGLLVVLFVGLLAFSWFAPMLLGKYVEPTGFVIFTGVVLLLFAAADTSRPYAMAGFAGAMLALVAHIVRLAMLTAAHGRQKADLPSVALAGASAVAAGAEGGLQASLPPAGMEPVDEDEQADDAPTGDSDSDDDDSDEGDDDDDSGDDDAGAAAEEPSDDDGGKPSAKKKKSPRAKKKTKKTGGSSSGKKE